MNILDKYFLKLLAVYSISSITILTLVFTFFKFLEEMRDIGIGNYGFNEALIHIILTIPSVSYSVMVLGILLGSIFTIGQLNTNKELQIFHTGGLSPKKILFKTIQFSFLMCFALLLFSELFAPATLKLADKIKNNAIGKIAPNNLQKNLWVKNDNKYILLNQSKSKKTSSSVRLFTFSDNTILSRYEYAENAEIDENKVRYKDHKAYRTFLKNDILSISRDENINKEKIIFLDGTQMKVLDTNLKTLNLIELSQISLSLHKNKLNYKDQFLEIASRLTKPFILLGMILIALPFVFNLDRNISIAKRIFIGATIGIFTHMLVRLFTVLSLELDALTLVGPILPILLLLILGIGLLKFKRII